MSKGTDSKKAVKKPKKDKKVKLVQLTKKETQYGFLFDYCEGPLDVELLGVPFHIQSVEYPLLKLPV